MEPERAWPLESLVAETRADVRHLRTDVAALRTEFRHDFRRLDGRISRVLLVQLATLLTALASLATALVTALD